MKREWTLPTWINNLEDQIGAQPPNVEQKYQEMGIMI